MCIRDSRYPDTKRKICPKCADRRSTVKRLFAFFGGYKKQVAMIILAMLLGTAITLITPQISTKTLYDEVLNAGNLKPVPQLLVSLGYMVLAIVGIRLINLLFTIAYPVSYTHLDVYKRQVQHRGAEARDFDP